MYVYIYIYVHMPTAQPWPLENSIGGVTKHGIGAQKLAGILRKAREVFVGFCWFGCFGVFFWCSEKTSFLSWPRAHASNKKKRYHLHVCPVWGFGRVRLAHRFWWFFRSGLNFCMCVIHNISPFFPVFLCYLTLIQFLLSSFLAICYFSLVFLFGGPGPTWPNPSLGLCFMLLSLCSLDRNKGKQNSSCRTPCV